jgi:hypothetical protein
LSGALQFPTRLKNFLTVLAVLTVVATPALAQSFDPDNGTGNVLPGGGSLGYNEMLSHGNNY